MQPQTKRRLVFGAQVKSMARCLKEMNEPASEIRRMIEVKLKWSCTCLIAQAQRCPAAVLVSS